MDEIELPPKRDPISIIPLRRMEIDFDFLNKQMEIAASKPDLDIEPQTDENINDEQYDDIKTEDETEEKKEEPMEDTTDLETETEDEADVEEEEEEEMDETVIKMLSEEEKVRRYVNHCMHQKNKIFNSLILV